jgi:hypothetical protein
MLLVYTAAATLLGPLRAELDMPGRARVLLRPRLGRVLRAHATVPIVIASAAAALAAAPCAVAGAPSRHAGATAVAAVAVVPLVALCAAMSARRGGRLPTTLMVTALAGDPSGGGGLIAAWLFAWPAGAAVVGLVPVVLVARATTLAGAAMSALVWIAVAGLVLVALLDRDPREA